MKIMLWLVLLLMPLWAGAQTTDNTLQQYAVRYMRGHWFLRNGDDFNVVDIDLEWPEVAAHQVPRALQHYLAGEMFGHATSDIDSMLLAYRANLGIEVAAPLEKIPDDDRFCYLTTRLRVVGYDPDRWIAYRLTCDDRPARLSKVKARSTTRYVVYDMVRRQVLMPNEMVRLELLQGDAADPDLLNLLLQPLDDDSYDKLKGVAINGVWFEAEGALVVLHITYTTDEKQIGYDMRLPYESVRYMLSRNARRLLDKKGKMPQTDLVASPLTWQGDTVYKSVDEMPVFKNGHEGLKTYLTGIALPKQTVPGKVMLSYVVDKEGWVNDVRVVSPLTPDLDRHAVNIAKGMPQYTPGKLRGQPACVRLYTPIYYK